MISNDVARTRFVQHHHMSVSDKDVCGELKHNVRGP